MQNKQVFSKKSGKAFMLRWTKLGPDEYEASVDNYEGMFIWYAGKQEKAKNAFYRYALYARIGRLDYVQDENLP